MSSLSSSSRKDADLTFLLVSLGLDVWKRSSELSSKMDGNVLLSLSFFSPASPTACVVFVAGGASEAEVDPNRPSEAKRSSSVVCSTLVLLLPLADLSFPAFLVPGSVKIRGRGVASDTEETEAAGNSVKVAWLDLSTEGKTKPDGPKYDSTASSAAEDFAACCLAALDWGLRCAVILARVCKTDDLHQKSRLRNRKHKDRGIWASPCGRSVVL